ncbi:YdbL family protein [Phenylobacterium sp. J367]|uniref:YdbL family protein n=1 Tax=Phenylobacterium sp. J367 TaxID=2898435 RepID=UPI002150E532|nr:YdbL family protein [Phenylobacterium sp. J367]MCR5877896.1 YdbL family protein [Phenylobacterium sp. J367]
MQGRELIGIGAAVMAALALTPAAVAQTAEAKAIVDQAKAAGIVGEQADGFLGFVTGAADPAVRQAVEEINAGRAQVYREAAARTGTTPAAAGASAFTQVVQARIKPGEFYKPAGGGWIRK